MAAELRLSRENLNAPFLQKLGEISGQNVFACYQCGKCSAGCLFAEHMDVLPNQVIRLLQLGDEGVLAARAPWVCAACLACSVRCPKGVDVARIMEALRQLALRRGIMPVQLKLDREFPQIALVGALRKVTP
ncbi:MAG: 4Fe-4S dicluster domain-containing protein [Candidatus Bipolaricaulota bacterium]|nr:4Fe-4S dicluster domain-containing protein [Candidatus Bipolaricaulota bacterium]MCX7844913.1 4Fe-4S dicluster domain-containing protein [Candidatus Bipolaricaulota bacterium]MDW8151775.1 4Fe-4S dicluster domain-containing protein [Candidatus Bipolaricaulota bacterium]